MKDKETEEYEEEFEKFYSRKRRLTKEQFLSGLKETCITGLYYLGFGAFMVGSLLWILT